MITKTSLALKYWEIIADNLKKAGFSLGWSPLSVVKGERSGLLMRIATGNASLCGRMNY
jgi:hypothetical protein